MAIDLKSLVGKLDEACRKTLEQAAGLTLSRTMQALDRERLKAEIQRLREQEPAEALAAARALTPKQNPSPTALVPATFFRKRRRVSGLPKKKGSSGESSGTVISS